MKGLITTSFCEVKLGIDITMTVSYKSYLQEIYAGDLPCNPMKIDVDPSRVVKIDETVLSKRKYHNRGSNATRTVGFW